MLEIKSQLQSAQAEEMIRKSRDNSAAAAQHAHNTLSYVKVVEPVNKAKAGKSKDPNDRSDSKTGPF